MKLNIPETYKEYSVLATTVIKDAYISQARDILKAKKSAYFKQTSSHYDNNGDVCLPPQTIIQFIRMDGTSVRIEILSSLDKSMNRVKFYTGIEAIKDLDCEPNK